MDAFTRRGWPGTSRINISASFSPSRFPLLAIACCLALAAPGGRAQSGAKGARISVPLKYSEKGTLVTRITLGPEEVRFRKEPDFDKRYKVIRRAIPIGPDRDDFVGLAIDVRLKKLYLDLNQNLDLTDDPQGVYQASMGTAVNLQLAYFRNVRLTLTREGIQRSYLLDPVYALNEDAFFYNRSAYEGEIELNGVKRLIQVQDNLDGRFDEKDLFTLTPPVRDSRARPVSFVPMPLCPNLFADGKPYRLSFALRPGQGDALLTATFEESAPRAGRLAVTGQPIRRLVLQGDTGIAILDYPGSELAIPADNYRLHRVYLDTPALVGASQSVRVAVTEGKNTALALGPPFSSSVRIDRMGNALLLRYLLKGASGEEYTITNPNRNDPPKFVIYKGDKKLDEGGFQFG